MYMAFALSLSLSLARSFIHSSIHSSPSLESSHFGCPIFISCFRLFQAVSGRAERDGFSRSLGAAVHAPADMIDCALNEFNLVASLLFANQPMFLFALPGCRQMDR